MNLARGFSRIERCRVAAICDEAASRLAAARQLLPDARAFQRIEDLLHDPAVQAVVIATPSQNHAASSLAALAAQKHVFVEKPMALSIEDARRLRDCAVSGRLCLMVGHVVCYNPAIQELARLVQAGSLGEVRAIAARRLGRPGPRRDEGPWWSLAPHDLSVIRMLLKNNPLLVSATALQVAKGRDPELVSAHLMFEQNREAFIWVGALGQRKNRRLAVLGSKRLALFADEGNASSLHLFEAPPKYGAEATDYFDCLDRDPAFGEAIDISPAEPLDLELRRFVDAALDGSPTLSDAEDGYSVVSALAAGARSMKLGGRPVSTRELAFDAPCTGAEARQGSEG